MEYDHAENCSFVFNQTVFFLLNIIEIKLSAYCVKLKRKRKSIHLSVSLQTQMRYTGSYFHFKEKNVEILQLSNLFFVDTKRFENLSNIFVATLYREGWPAYR